MPFTLNIHANAQIRKIKAKLIFLLTICVFLYPWRKYLPLEKGTLCSLIVGEQCKQTIDSEFDSHWVPSGRQDLY